MPCRFKNPLSRMRVAKSHTFDQWKENQWKSNIETIEYTDVTKMKLWEGRDPLFKWRLWGMLVWILLEEQDFDEIRKHMEWPLSLIPGGEEYDKIGEPNV